MIERHPLEVPSRGPERAFGRVTVADDLQGALVAMIDLALLTKQLWWCAEGSGADAARPSLGAIEQRLRTRTDDVAGRMVALGHVPNGQSRTVAIETGLAPLPARRMTVAEVVAALDERFRLAAEQLVRPPGTPAGDPATGQMLMALRSELEQHRAAIAALGG